MSDRAVAVAIRLFGVIDLCGVGAVVMPFAWMAVIHGRLGFGTLPDAPIVHYFARHVSLWYAVHAATFLFLSTDVPRFRPVIRFIAWLGIGFVLALTAVNVASGMPGWWTVGQLLGGGLENVVLLVLLRVSRPGTPSHSFARAEARG